ncbi:hypothetical protein MICAF_5280002 [Microcystis aeruginosa PCC 9807]|uniref:Uncharacterized protein n=1 Tax=Microcystis aeruginosa PCC 9807 TaxID=1160283 RepID=I4HC40_MICAE|nr:hypothetical protein MICAF_5280002 [Microcystis aeruginosa PCC 9807]
MVTLLSQGLVLAQNICTFRKQQIGNRKLGNKQEPIYVMANSSLNCITV